MIVIQSLLLAVNWAGIGLTALRILIAIVVFGIIIFVHELGHFLMCKLMGVKVNEFAMGMGPKILRFGKKETAYTLRLFPIGGFCAMEGEDAAGGGSIAPAEQTGDTEGEAAEPTQRDPRAFCNKKVWRRVLIVVAGAVMNLILGYVLLVVYYGACVKPEAEGVPAMFSSTIIAELPEGAPSYQTGLRVGDEITKINGKMVFTDRDVAMLMQSDEDGVMDITVKRTTDGKKQTLVLPGVRFELRKDEATGKQYLFYDFKVAGVPKTVLSTLAEAGKMEVSVATMIWRSLGDIVTGKYGLNELSGPVGVVDAIGDAAVQEGEGGQWVFDLGTLLMLTVMITVNVGIFNLLPLPALDGGRLIFLVFEGIFRRPIPAKYEGMVHAIGLLLLFALMIVVTFSDIWRLASGG